MVNSRATQRRKAKTGTAKRAPARAAKAKPGTAKRSPAKSGTAARATAKAKARDKAAAGDKAGSKRPSATPATLQLARYRRPLEGTLARGDRAQVAALLEAEGLGTIAEARANDELTLECVDVVDTSETPLYQLYLWPFGSAVLYAHGTTRVIGGAVQHGFAREDGGDPGLVAQLAAAWSRDARRLGIQESIEFERTPSKTSNATIAAPPPDDIGALLERLRPGDEHRRDAMAAYSLVVGKLFPEWRPYPKRRFDDLSIDQQAFLERALDTGFARSLELAGLFARPEHNERYYRSRTRPQQPADVHVKVGGETLPLWMAVSDVASGHLEPGPVLGAFRALPADQALAAWTEIARGDAYDLHAAHPLSMKEAGIPRTPANVKHRTRLFQWMADASLALGEAGEAAAFELVKEPNPHRRIGQAKDFIGLLALARHAKARGGVLDPSHDVLLASLVNELAEVFAAPVLQEIRKLLPKDRAAALPPLR